MTESEFEKLVEQKFDSDCKSVIENGAKNARRVAENRLNHQIMLEDMDGSDPKLENNDEYRITYTNFRVLNQNITIHNERLAWALEQLTPEKRDILLMAHFLDMTDKEISLVIQIPRRTVCYYRMEAMQTIRTLMCGEP